MKGGHNMLVQWLTIAGLIGGGIWGAELHYAKEVPFQQHVQAHSEERRQLRREVLETRRALLETQLYELKIAKERRALIPLERQRLEQLELELEHLNEQMSALDRGAS